MKKIFAISALVLALSTPAFAGQKEGLNQAQQCGWPAHCGAKSPDTPLPTSAKGVSANDTSTVIGLVVNLKAQLLADLTAADAEAMFVNSNTGQMFDPIADMCLSGIPAIPASTTGPGRPAVQGLIAWVGSLQSPVGAAGLPPMSKNPGPAELAEHARLVILAGKGIVNTVVNSLNNGGVPSDIQQSCGSLVQAPIMDLVAFNTVLLKFLPKL